MKNYEEIKKFVTEYKGMITIDDFQKENISHHYINQLIEDKIIERVGIGVYNKCGACSIDGEMNIPESEEILN